MTYIYQSINITRNERKQTLLRSRLVEWFGCTPAANKGDLLTAKRARISTGSPTPARFSTKRVDEIVVY